MKTLKRDLPLVGEIRNITEDMKEKRYHEFTLSSEAVDTYRTVFTKKGWDLNRYNRNPVVTYVHDDNSSNPDMVLGTGEVFFDGDDLVGRVYYEPADLNPVAEKVRRKVEHGTLRMASIHAFPHKASMGDENAGEDPSVMYFRNQELLAWSIVPIGSNPEAHKRSVEAIREIKKELVAEIEVEGANELKKEERAETMDVCEAQYLINKNNS